MAEKQKITLRYVSVSSGYSDGTGRVELQGPVETGPASCDGRQVLAFLTPKAARELAVDLIKQAEDCDDFNRKMAEKWGNRAESGATT